MRQFLYEWLTFMLFATFVWIGVACIVFIKVWYDMNGALE